MDLAEAHAELVAEIQDGLQYAAEPAHMQELGAIFDTLALQLEGLGLCHLLELADAEEFRVNMVRSGQSRRFFLRRSRLEKNTDDRHLAISRTRAVLDAVVAGALDLARDIAALSTDLWNGSWEYEDDFCFYLLVHHIVTSPATFPTLESTQTLARFERSLEGGASVHFDVAKALVERDAAALLDALKALLEAEAAKIEKDRESAAVHERDILFWPKSGVSIDGLALLKLAELLGIAVDEELPLCPTLGRLPWSNAHDIDIFLEIEALG